MIKADDDALLNGITNSGSLQIGHVVFEGTINNTGTISLPSGTLAMTGNVTLAGSGSVAMSGTSNLVQNDSTGTLISQQTIHGYGTIYALPLTNQDIVSADSKGNTLMLADNTTTNTGTIQAKNGGILETNSDAVVSNAGGTIEALTGSTVILEGTVSGGTLKTGGSGTVQVDGTLDGTTNTLTNAGTLQANNDNLYAEGTINNTGTIALTGNSCIVLDEPVALTGSGKLTMASSTCIYGSGIAFTNESTIAGAGSIGDSNPMPITSTMASSR
ncbi:MAG TPA: hypothetical protein VMR62_30500 [Bryobacteraceae bacterium]|nr:hypothetical protein [Bryobacteraceae bacterium]